MHTLLLAALALPLLVLLDVLWIQGIGGSLHQEQLGALLRADVLWPAAAAFYIVYALALSFLVLVPAVGARSFSYALVGGAVLGCLAYATYGLTNLATLAHWPLALTFIELAWGVVMTSAASSIAYLLAIRLHIG